MPPWCCRAQASSSKLCSRTHTSAPRFFRQTPGPRCCHHERTGKVAVSEIFKQAGIKADSTRPVLREV
jgi:hypothetical protein